jgi:hypothetical protein
MGNVHVIKSIEMEHACLGEETTIAHLNLHTLEPHPHSTFTHDLPIIIGITMESQGTCGALKGAS